MHKRESRRRRMRALDETSFRFKRGAQTFFVNDLPVEVHVSAQGIIELQSADRMIRVSGTTYWEMIYDDVVPTQLLAGIIQAKYDELVGRLRQELVLLQEES